jgi:hypothetical protein
MRQRSLGFLAGTAAVWAALTAPAHAYIDPGTGSMLLQLIGAGIAGALFYLRNVRMYISNLFRRRDASKDSAGTPDGK